MALPPARPSASSSRRCSEGAARWALRPGLACSLLLLTLLAPQARGGPVAAADQPRTTAGTTIAPPGPDQQPSAPARPAAAGSIASLLPPLQPSIPLSAPPSASARRAAAAPIAPFPPSIKPSVPPSEPPSATLSALSPRPISTPSAVLHPVAAIPASGAPANPRPDDLPGPLPGRLPAPAASTPEPALGVWLTTVDSAVMYDPAEAERALAFLRHNGFRRAALPLYTAGVVTWTPSPARNRLAIPTDPLLPPSTSAGPGAESARHHGSAAPAGAAPAGGRGAGLQGTAAALAAASLGLPAGPSARSGAGSVHGVGPTVSLLAALGRAGLERVGWFEFGLMAPAGAPWLAGRDDLLLRDASGSSLWQESPGLNRVWLNPILPEVQQLLEDLVVDACTQLPLEAIQFDDHLGYPVRFGYDPATLAAWRASDAGRRNPSPAPDEPAWIAWRAEQVTALLERLRAAMNSACPAVRISVSPNPQEFSYNHYLADWSTWVRRGLVDEVVVQIYRDNLAALGRELGHPSLAAAAVRVPVRIGLLAGLKSQPKDPAQLRRELELVQGRGYRGIDLFFYESARRHFDLPH